MNTLWEDKIAKTFKKSTPSDIEILIDLISMSLCTRHDCNVGHLYSVLGSETFSKLVANFSGKTFTLPDKEEFETTLLVAVCYYYKSVKGLSWKQIKEQLPFKEDEISTISVGKGISKLKESLRQEIDSLFKEGE